MKPMINPIGGSTSNTSAPYKATIYLTDSQIRDLWSLLDMLYECKWEEPSDLMMVESYACLMDFVATAKTEDLTQVPEVGHKWEGVVCDTPSCNHSSNFHANQRGLCSAESCACMTFINSGRAL